MFVMYKPIKQIINYNKIYIKQQLLDKTSRSLLKNFQKK
jgi:hypothetical protein